MNISNIAGGALVEQVDIEIEKIVKNIMDPNTDVKKKRKITIVLEFKADEDRELSEVRFSTKSDLAPQKSVKTIIAFDKNKDGNVVVEELMKNGAKGQVWINNDAELLEPKTVSKILNIK